MADESPSLPLEPAVEPSEPAAPAPETDQTPLDQAPLGEFVKRRAKGETEGEPVATDTESTDSQEEPTEPGKPKTTKPGFKNRFDQIYRQRSDALRQVEAEKARATQLEQELQQLRQKVPAEPVAPPPAAPTSPNLDQYLAAGKTYEDWMDARIEWQAQRIADARIQAFQQRGAQEQAEAERQKQLAGFGERTEQAKATYPDYEEKVMANDRVHLSPVMTDVATRSPHGTHIMYWLGTHEAEANQLGELTKAYGPAAFPLVEQHLLLLSGHSPSSNGSLPGAKKAVPVSHAPAPISPVGGGSSVTTVSLDELSLKDYVARRNAADQKKRTG